MRPCISSYTASAQSYATIASPATVHIAPIVRAAVQCHTPHISQVMGPLSRAATQVVDLQSGSCSATSPSAASKSPATSIASLEPDSPIIQTALQVRLSRKTLHSQSRIHPGSGKLRCSWESVSRPDSAAFIPSKSAIYGPYSPSRSRAVSAVPAA